jgi:hypothetical protein
MPISISSSGSFQNTERFLRSLQKMDLSHILTSEAEKGVRALSQATPVDSGRAANSWAYEISQTASSITIGWTNSDNENGYPVALMIQYGHGTGTGGYVAGIDYINPAMRPIFDEIAETVWKAVISA